MLIEFEVGNFLSFHKPVRLSMYAATPFKEFEADNVFNAGGRRMLKSAVIYGANASGKSNLLAALAHMRWLVLNSSKESQAGEPISVRPFKLDVKSVKEPSRFEVVFRIDKSGYRYGFELDATRICSEWLFRAEGKKEQPLFLREGETIDIQTIFNEGENLQDKTRSNALFLSVVAQFNGANAKKILEWFSNIQVVHGEFEGAFRRKSLAMLKENETKELLLNFLHIADLTIQDLEITEADSDNAQEQVGSVLAKRIKASLGPHLLQAALREPTPQLEMGNGKVRALSLSSLHSQYDTTGKPVGIAALDFDSEESEGTKKLFSMAGPILTGLVVGRVVVIDEIDAKLHPLLTRKIVELFNSSETNKHNAQLIFCTHDTSLLRYGKFRRDQIWFTEKNHLEATDLYSLAEFKTEKGTSIRKDASFDKDYIRGRYGAIPVMGDFREILLPGEGEE